MDEGASTSPDDLLEGVLERIGEPSHPLASLARAYLHRIPWDVAMAVEPAHHEVVGLYEFIRSRIEPIAVRVFNPTLETDGYESHGTVVEVHADDMPFLVDSVTNELQAHGLEVERVLHPVIGTVRDPAGDLIEILRPGLSPACESVQHYVLDRRLSAVDLPGIESRLREVLGEVRLAVRDFDALVDVVGRMLEIVKAGRGFYHDVEVNEAVAFLEWLREDNFVFLGYREYRVDQTPDGRTLEGVAGSGLGILSDPERSKAHEAVLLSDLPPDLASRYLGGDLLVISKTNRLSAVHRRAKMDYLGVRMLGPDGETVGEARMLGLFTSKAYMESVLRIPVLRQKVVDIAATEDLIAGSHDHKAMVALVEGFPKDELFGLPTEDLRRVLMGLLALQERAQVRLFVRRDLLDRGVRILVAMPRDRYSSSLARRLQALFLKRFDGSSVDYHLTMDRSDIARLHFTVWVPSGQVPDVAFEELDAEVTEMTRSWPERVAEELSARLGEDTALEMVERWAPRLPDYYASSTPLLVAAGDIENLDELVTSGRSSLVGLQNETEGHDILTRVALYENQGKRALSELTPALEDMGLRVVEEVPTRLAGDDDVFIHDFGVLDSKGERLDLDAAGERVAATLAAVWQGSAESDSLHRLVLAADLTHEQVAILRAYGTYWRRVNSIFTVNYVNATLVVHPEISAGLVRLFELRFDPESDGAGYDELQTELLERLDAVPSLDEDRILRTFLRLVDATLRTNAYRSDRRSLAFKLRSADVPDMPSPRPYVEVFVYSDDVEGVHLRAGKRARGGIRWSERREDYRTEVLGLMKAQNTKNAVIVPTGAKGGFVLRRPPTEAEAVPDAVRTAYETYIRGLLDVTDNLVDGEAVHPAAVRVHDGADPYLVVAADKGTARFSDLANGIAAEYGFWLDDAFASGGATGYDHKGLGITARGAWKSLERHLLPEGVDPHQDTFTIVGIGDMSGDVFGNGMLGSDTMQLVAAFDHRHIFVDPTPDPAVSYTERRRLFELPRSSWADYDASLISEGGGVFARSAKKIHLSEQARRVLGADVETVTPAELVSVVLRAPVDVLWNGGIGTYVKATSETSDDVGDRTNDAVRVNGSDLRARVVVEGGNLGLTQRGRIEYAAAGGHINTDFIDNSGGVNCSDREVNLKILLRLAEQGGAIARSERDALMKAEADNVVAAILGDNVAQAQALALEESVSSGRIDAYEQLMTSLEAEGLLERDLEALPSSQQMTERARAGIGLSRPELAVLHAYAKRSLADTLLGSGLPDEWSLRDDLAAYFPGQIADRFGTLAWDHPLRRELVATIIANEVVDSQGPTFVAHQAARAGADPAQVVGAYRTAREVAGGRERRRDIEKLAGAVDYEIWTELMRADHRLVSTLTRWHLRRGEVRHGTDMAGEVRRLEAEIGDWGSLQWRLERSARIDRLRAAGVPDDVARRTVYAFDMVHAPDILEVAAASGRPPVDVARAFYRMGQILGLDNLERAAAKLKLTDPWQRWALQTVEDDLLDARRALVDKVLSEGDGQPVDKSIEQFLSRRQAAVARVLDVCHSVEAGGIDDSAPLIVAVRQIESLAT